MSTATLGWRDTNRKKTIRAVLLSILIHLLLIALIAVIVGLEPAPVPVPEEEDKAIEVTFIPPPPPSEETPFLNTTEAQRSETAPEQPAFESDKDTRAASELPADGQTPLPSQAGEESPGINFENREYTAGPEQPTAPAQPETRPQEEAPPVEQPTEAKQEQQKEAKPEATPEPPTAEVALLQPVRPKTEPRPTPAEAKPETPPAPSALSGYQPQTRITRLKGNINNRGRSSADAVSTPLGRYKKQLSDAIGSRWYYYVNEAISLLNVGTLELRFIVKADGKVEKVQVLRNSSNESFASTSVRAVMDAEIPPIPEEIQPLLNNGQIEVEYTFSILPN